MNIAKWRYKLEIFKVKKFLCVMMLFVLAARVAYSENVGQETKTINTVTTRQAIGPIFSDGSDNGRTVLHFQLRRERDKLNPEPWLNR